MAVQSVNTEYGNVEQSAPAKRRGVNLIGALLLGGVVVAAVIFGLGLSRQGQTQPTSGLAPEFTLKTLDGQEIALASLRGQVVVVNFWASWCGPCRAEAPELEAAWKKYKDQGVVFLGIAYTDTERGARAYIEEFQITYPNALDFKTAISEQYRIQGIPETFIIDREGNITDFVMMPLTQGQIGKMIEKALAKQG